MSKPHYHGHRGRLRERFLNSGLDAFSDYEAVELLLTLAIPRNDVKEAAKNAVQEFGSFRGVLDAPVEDLQKIKGIGQVAPVAIKIIREAAARYLKQECRDSFRFESQESLNEYCRISMGALKNEIFKVIFLDNTLKILSDKNMDEGTVDRAVVYPRKIIEEAIRCNATTLIFAHNHPSGNARPSEQDKDLTRALILAAETMQLRVFDHLIVTKDDIFSFRREGLL